jgi:ATPase family associated with various cellular activities (AAA)
MSTSITVSTQYERPAFLDSLSNAYSDRGKSVAILSGDTHDLFWSKQQGRFLELEQTLYQALNGMFTMMRLDIATGLGFYDPSDVLTLSRACAQADALATKADSKVGDLRDNIHQTRYSPLPAIVLLQEILQAITTARRDNKQIKPVCCVAQFAGSLVPNGNFDQLAEVDRQRLVTFLNLIEAPWFKSSSNLIVLIADTRTEVNSRIVALPSVQHIEIELPNATERDKFVQYFLSTNPQTPAITFEKGPEMFVEDTAGLALTAVQDILEVGRRTGNTVTRKDVLEEINEVMSADLGDIVRISRPEHTRADIVGYKKTGEIFMDIFRRCEDPQTAVPAILVSGPNGAGKTFQLEAYACESGRVVIELIGLRGMYFGQTETFFEKLRLRIKTYGKILILVDEAHTQFGSVHRSDTHETEKRLAGNIIKMMGDRAMFGKVLWGLMTSRPDELDPDVKSRSPIQVPIFDLDGDERKQFVTELFARKGVPIPEGEVDAVLKKTENYSARDYDFLVKEVRGSGRTSVLQTLEVWQASASILKQRRLQTLLAAEHCSYPALLPEALKPEVQGGEIEDEIQQLKALLLR